MQAMMRHNYSLQSQKEISLETIFKAMFVGETQCMDATPSRVPD